MTNLCESDNTAKQLNGADVEIKIAYWTEQLAGAPPLLELPTDRPRSLVQTFALAKRLFTIDTPLTESLRVLSHAAGSSLAMTLLAAFKTLLYRYSGQEDILVGTRISDKLPCNIPILWTQVAGSLTFSELLDRVCQSNLAVEPHQETAASLHLGLASGQIPLSQVMFEWGNLPQVTAKFELMLSISETAAGLAGSAEVDRSAGAAAVALLCYLFRSCSRPYLLG